MIQGVNMIFLKNLPISPLGFTQDSTFVAMENPASFQE